MRQQRRCNHARPLGCERSDFRASGAVLQADAAREVTAATLSHLLHGTNGLMMVANVFLLGERAHGTAPGEIVAHCAAMAASTSQHIIEQQVNMGAVDPCDAASIVAVTSLNAGSKKYRLRKSTPADGDDERAPAGSIPHLTLITCMFAVC